MADLMKGDLVRHEQYGIGRVEAVPKGGGDACEVHFPRLDRQALVPTDELEALSDAETASYEPSTPPPGQPYSLSSESAPRPLRKPFYSVQLGAFKDEERAEALAKKFQEKGYDAFTQVGVAKDNSPIYRVLVSKYEERKAAQKLAGEIQSKEAVQTTLYAQ